MPECLESVNGYSGYKVKGFKTREAAETFVRENLGSRPKSSRPKSSSHLSPKDSTVGMEAVQQHSDTNSLLSTTIQPERQNDPGVVSIVEASTHNAPFPTTQPTPSRRIRRLAIFGPIEARTQKNGAPFPTTQTKPTQTRPTQTRRRIRRQRKSLSALETMDFASIDTDTRPKKRPRTDERGE
jgi:hypothetical protein